MDTDILAVPVTFVAAGMSIAVFLNRNKSSNVILQNAWNRYGPDAFVFSVLEYVDDKEMLIPTEQQYLDELKPEYNIMKIADRPTGVSPSLQTRKKISKALQDRPHTEEYKQKMRELMADREFTPQHRANLKAAWENREVTDEQIAAFQERMNSPEIAEKRNKAIKGKKRTDEQCQYLSKVHKERLEKPEAKAEFLAMMQRPEVVRKRVENRRATLLRKQEEKRRRLESESDLQNDLGA